MSHMTKENAKATARTPLEAAHWFSWVVTVHGVLLRICHRKNPVAASEIRITSRPIRSVRSRVNFIVQRSRADMDHPRKIEWLGSMLNLILLELTLGQEGKSALTRKDYQSPVAGSILFKPWVYRTLTLQALRILCKGVHYRGDLHNGFEYSRFPANVSTEYGSAIRYLLNPCACDKLITCEATRNAG